jgi:CheY-like chemotaxis protein
LNSPVVLIVDDSRAMQEILVDTLRLEGMRTLVASYGREALALMRTHQPNLVLLDFNLSGTMNGIEVLQTIRKTPQFASTPVVLLTAEHIAAEQREAQEADLIMLKPVEPDEFVQLISRLLNSQRPKPVIKKLRQPGV